MSRDEKDRRVRQVMRAYDHAAACPIVESQWELAMTTASDIITLGSRGEDFLDGGWSVDGVRAILLACALNAPSNVLAGMVKRAKRQIAFVDWWDREGFAAAHRVPSTGRAA